MPILLLLLLFVRFFCVFVSIIFCCCCSFSFLLKSAGRQAGSFIVISKTTKRRKTERYQYYRWKHVLSNYLDKNPLVEFDAGRCLSAYYFRFPISFFSSFSIFSFVSHLYCGGCCCCCSSSCCCCCFISVIVPYFSLFILKRTVFYSLCDIHLFRCAIRKRITLYGSWLCALYVQTVQ